MKASHPFVNIAAVVFAAALLLSCGHRSNKDQAGAKLDWTSDIASATSKAKELKKDLLVAFKTEWCPYCKFVDEKIFPKKHVADALGEFVLVHVDGDKPENQALLDSYSVSGFPTFVIIDSGGKEILRFGDVESEEKLISLLEDASSKDPAYKALREAETSLAKGDDAATKALYLRVRSLIGNDKSSPLAERTTAGLLRVSERKSDEAKAVLKELVRDFPDSVHRPEYLKQYADLMHSHELKRQFLNEAAAIIERNIVSIEKGDQTSDQITVVTLGEHVDLLSEIYQELGRYSDIAPAYTRAARLDLEQMEKDGGIKNSKHLVGQTAGHFIGAGDLDGAWEFAEFALAELPDYWPVYSTAAKIKLRMKRFGEALPLARTAYGMAEVVAKPRVAMLIAEIHAGSGDLQEAIVTLHSAEEDLSKVQGSTKGRASKMMEKLKAQAKEYESVLK